MTHKELLIYVQKACHVDQTHCSVMLNSLCRLMAQAGVEQVPVTIPGLGTFTSHKHPEYIQEDSSNGRQTLFPPRISYRMQPEEEHSATDDMLVQQLADSAKFPVQEAAAFINALSQSVISLLSKGEEVEIHGLGTFRVVSSRQGEIQRTAFTPDEQMRTAVNAPFSCFEPVVIKPANEGPITVAETSNSEEPVTTQQEQISAEEREISDLQEYSEISEPEPVIMNIEKAEQEPEPAKVKVENAEQKPKPVKPQKEDPQKTTLIRVLAALLIIACVALVWFIFQIDVNEPTFAEEVKTEESMPVIEEEELPGSEIFFGENSDSSQALALNDQPDPIVEVSSAEPELPVVTEPKTDAKIEDKTATVSNHVEPKVEKAETEAASSKKEIDSKPVDTSYGRKKNADGSFATHKLEKGGRLTLVALEHYGDKAFWPYIFEVNRDKLKNPSLVQPGMVLYLPDPQVFGIDANNEESVAKAKAKARQYLQ